MAVIEAMGYSYREYNNRITMQIETKRFKGSFVDPGIFRYPRPPGFGASSYFPVKECLGFLRSSPH